MKHALLAVLALLLTGCGTLKGQFENRIACSAAGDILFVVSMYGPIGIASKIADPDRERVCP